MSRQLANWLSQCALVSDILRNITYTARRGKQAYRNGQKISPSAESSLEEAVVGIDLGTPKSEDVALKFISLLRKTKHLRHLGANALEICYVADGTTDAFIDVRGKLRVTDVAAAYLILLEAGGIMTTLDEEELDVPLTPTQTVSFVATNNRHLHGVIRSLFVQNPTFANLRVCKKAKEIQTSSRILVGPENVGQFSHFRQVRHFRHIRHFRRIPFSYVRKQRSSGIFK